MDLPFADGHCFPTRIPNLFSRCYSRLNHVCFQSISLLIRCSSRMCLFLFCYALRLVSLVTKRLPMHYGLEQPKIQTTGPFARTAHSLTLLTPSLMGK